MSFVEQQGFHEFMAETQPLFKFYTRNTLRSDAMKMYEAEKAMLLKLLGKNSSRIAITTDMWSSDCQNKGYMAITAHFIDDDWNLQNRLVRFAYVPAPHTTEVLSDVLVNSLYDWNIDRKLSTLTVDNCSTNDAMIHLVLDKISPSNFVKRGEFFHMRCCAHIVNLIVKDGMNAIYGSIEKIRDSVSFWVATREEKFEETCRQLNINYRRKLALDCRTRWNSTYLMLASTLPYREVFERLRHRKSLYKVVPPDDEWEMANELVDKLEVFYSVTELFFGTLYPTTNLYFSKVCEMRLNLNEWLFSPNEMIHRMATNMISKFEKYWDQINEVMAVGAILDPRYKMKLLKFFS
ncbi:putative AC transposase isoform X1 [Arachis hypogaea]|uniref:putative AC transposase isoform X1 n=1 Tax=Arachis hypogaea TaxID=3818 RepID=UPI003B22832D